MGDRVGTSLDCIGKIIRRKRTRISRRTYPDSQVTGNCDPSLSSTPPSDDNPDCSINNMKNDFNLNRYGSRVALSSELESISDGKRCSEGALALANWKCSSVTDLSKRNGERCSIGMPRLSFDGEGNENKVKKLKLKVSGVTRTIQTNTTNSSLYEGTSDISGLHQMPNLQEISSHNQSLYMKNGLCGIPWKDFSVGFNLGKESSMGKMKYLEKSEAVRKNKRASKRCIMGRAFDDDVEDDEIRYLEKLRTLSAGYKNDMEQPGKKSKRVLKNFNDNIKPRSDEAYQDVAYTEADLTSDGECEDGKKNVKKESIQTMEGKREMTLTSRQRALQSGKDVSASACSVDFPNGLPPAPSRKQKEKLTEVEQQLKKAEAALKRRVQVEKAARESEAEAIRKILGQDSSRKKREDKMKKRRDELAQEKAANALMLASNTIRWVMGPSGTTVTFPNEMGLPHIFNSKPHSYPPPREKCAGPSCVNPYKYRDSKSKLPLCSLQCYKAVQGKVQAEATC